MELTETRKSHIKTSIEALRHAADLLELDLRSEAPYPITQAGKKPENRPEIVVMIRDGAIDTVLGNQTVLDMNPEITVVEANTENPDAPAADEDYLNFTYYEKNGYTDLPFNTDDGTPVQ